MYTNFANRARGRGRGYTPQPSRARFPGDQSATQPVHSLLTMEPIRPTRGLYSGGYEPRNAYDHQRFEGYNDPWNEEQSGYEQDDGDYYGYEEGFGGDDYVDDVYQDQGYTEEGNGEEYYEEQYYEDEEEEIAETIVTPKPTDRPRECAVCQRYVTQPASHANARHLPWFVNPTSACAICGIQFNNKMRLDNHAATEHPEQVTAMPPKQWVTCMKQLFKMLGSKLGVIPEDIPKFVRENGLANKVQGSFTEEDQMYFDEPSFMGQRSFNTMNPICLRDCTHWQIILRLIAFAGEVHPALIRSSNPEEGYIFCPMPGEVIPVETRETAQPPTEAPKQVVPPKQKKKKKKKRPVQQEEDVEQKPKGPKIFSVAEMLTNIKDGKFDAETVNVEVPAIKKAPQKLQPQKRPTAPTVFSQHERIRNQEVGPPPKVMRPLEPGYQGYGRGRGRGQPPVPRIRPVLEPPTPMHRPAYHRDRVLPRANYPLDGVVEDRHYNFGNATEEFREWANQGSERIASAFDAVVMRNKQPLLVPQFPEKTKFSPMPPGEGHSAIPESSAPHESSEYSTYQQEQPRPLPSRPAARRRSTEEAVQSYVHSIRQETESSGQSEYQPVYYTQNTNPPSARGKPNNTQAQAKPTSNPKPYVYTNQQQQKQVVQNQPSVSYNRQANAPKPKQPYIYSNQQSKAPTAQQQDPANNHHISQPHISRPPQPYVYSNQPQASSQAGQEAVTNSNQPQQQQQITAAYQQQISLTTQQNTQSASEAYTWSAPPPPPPSQAQPPAVQQATITGRQGTAAAPSQAVPSQPKEDKAVEIPKVLQDQLKTLTQGMAVLSEAVMQLSKK